MGRVGRTEQCPEYANKMSIYIDKITQTIIYINLQNLHVAQHLYNHNWRRLIEGLRWKIAKFDAYIRLHYIGKFSCM